MKQPLTPKQEKAANTPGMRAARVGLSGTSGAIFGHLIRGPKGALIGGGLNASLQGIQEIANSRRPVGKRDPRKVTPVIRVAAGAAAIGSAGYVIHREVDKFRKWEAAGSHQRSVDEIGGTTADKLERMARRAKGTPEGDAAAVKLDRLRSRQGKTFAGKAKTMITKIVSRKKVSKFAGHILSAHGELQSIIDLGRVIEFEREHERVRGAAKVGAVGAAAGSVLGGLIGRRYGLGKIGAINGGVRGATVGAVVGAVTARKKKIELSAREELDEIRFGRGDIARRDLPWAKSDIFPRGGGGKQSSAALELLLVRDMKRRGFVRNSRGVITKITKESLKLSAVESTAREELNSIIELKEIDLGHTYDNYGSCEVSPTPRKKSFPSLNIYDREQDIDLPLEGRATVRYKLKSKTIRQDDAGKKRHSADIEIQSIDPIEEVKNRLISGKAVKLLNARDQLDNIIEFGAAELIKPGMTGAVEEILKRNAPRVNARGRMIKRFLPNFPTPIGGGGIRKNGFIQKEAADALRKHRNKAPDFLTQGLSSRDQLSEIIRLSDPRPRNDLGMFTDSEEGAPNPNQIDSVYKQTRRSVGQNLAGGAVAGVGAAASSGAIKALLKKIGKVRA